MNCARCMSGNSMTSHTCRARPIQYSERIDAVIYISPATRDMTRDEWCDLALAALDQAGLPAQTQEEFRRYLNAWKDLNP